MEKKKVFGISIKTQIIIVATNAMPLLSLKKLTFCLN